MREVELRAGSYRESERAATHGRVVQPRRVPYRGVSGASATQGRGGTTSECAGVHDERHQQVVAGVATTR